MPVKVSFLGLEIHHEGVRRRHQLRPGINRIGRAPDNDVILDREDVSRYHAELLVTDDGLRVRDLGSTNGTFVNAVRITEAGLEPGDSLVVGSSLMLVVDLDPKECEVALSIPVSGESRRAPAAAAQPAPPGTRGGEGEMPARWLGVLRAWVAAWASGNVGASRGALESVRAALGATAVAVVGCPEHGDAGVLGLVGEMTEPGALGETVGTVLASHHRDQGDASGWDALNLDRGALLLIGWAGIGPGRRAVIALDPACAPRRAGVFLEELALGLPAEDGGDAIAECASSDPASRLVFPQGYLVCRSAAMRRLYRDLERFTASELPVFLVGETGVGKEAIARAIHLSSPRSKGPFIAVNCAAIPADLLEAELFGIEDRVATGVAARPGKMSLASGGVLFFDEISEMPVSLQPKLLRALEERQVYPVGARRPVPVDVRLVSATNRDAARCLESGRLRPDLYYRISGCVLRIPPLSERPGDVPSLVQHFVEEAATEIGREVRGVTARALDALVARPWPGNVRELRNEVWRLVHLCPDGGLITSDLLENPVSCVHPGEGQSPSPFALEPRIRALERDLILATLTETGGNRTRAAKLLGLSRYGLLLKIRRLGLEEDLP